MPPVETVGDDHGAGLPGNTSTREHVVACSSTLMRLWSHAGIAAHSAVQAGAVGGSPGR